MFSYSHRTTEDVARGLLRRSRRSLVHRRDTKRHRQGRKGRRLELRRQEPRGVQGKWSSKELCFEFFKRAHARKIIVAKVPHQLV